MEYRIGTMTEGNAIGRSELLKWLNELLDTHYGKVEEVSNGLLFLFILYQRFPLLSLFG